MEKVILKETIGKMLTQVVLWEVSKSNRRATSNYNSISSTSAGQVLQRQSTKAPIQSVSPMPDDLVNKIFRNTKEIAGLTKTENSCHAEINLYPEMGSRHTKYKALGLN